MKLGLENISKLLAALGDPQEKYLKVQVAGTNGKGSVCAFLDSICLRAGIRTGVYTSPHLVSITERVRIGGTDISEKEFAHLASRVRETSERLVADQVLENPPTFFEQVTAIALSAFAEAKVELAILETGLGGRYDATTAAGAEIAVITRIDLDHQEYLGETIEQIAAEKAAIIGSGSRAVLLHQSRQVDQVLDGRCREVGVQPVWATRQVKIKRDPAMKEYLVADFATGTGDYQNVLLYGMFGEHQVENAAVAIAAAEVVASVGFEIDTDAVIYGIQEARHPGRLEYFDGILFDGAHNVGGAKALRTYLDEFVDKPITLIFGAMNDKASKEMLELIAPKARSIILTKADNSRAMEPQTLVGLLPGSVRKEIVTVTGSAGEALRCAAKVSDGSIILVTGSLYLVGEAKSLISKKSV